jgi:predicted ATPase
LTSFVGRQDELASITKAVHASRLVTLTGTGWVGKTRVALQGAANLVTDFSAGVWLCELAAAVDRESMLQVVAAALGYAPAPGADLEGGIARFVGSRRMLVVLAAARVIALGPREISAHLDERFRLLTGGRRVAVERHHTLRVTVDWSYALLSEREQTVFNHLGVFPASFDASAAQAVSAAGGVEPWDVLDALTSLVAKSMLNADRSSAGPTRYQMLESLRHHGQECLDTAGVADETRRCHTRHYAGIVAEIGSGLRGPDEPLWRGRLDADLDNFRAAVAWALDSAPEEDGELAMVILGELTAGLLGAMTSLFAAVAYQKADERARQSTSPYASLVMADAADNALLPRGLRSRP